MSSIKTVRYLHRGFFIIVLDLRLTKLVRGCRETAFNCFISLPYFPPHLLHQTIRSLKSFYVKCSFFFADFLSSLFIFLMILKI